MYVGIFLALCFFSVMVVLLVRRKQPKAPTPRLYELLARIPREWNRSDYILSGSASLAFRGVRDVHDLDLLISPNLAAELGSDLVNRRSDGRLAVKIDGIDIFENVPRLWNVTFDDISAETDTFDGYLVQSLRHTLAIKALLPVIRDKDRPDMVELSRLIAKEPKRTSVNRVIQPTEYPND